MESRIERAVLHLQHILRGSLYVFRDLMAMRGTEKQRAQNEHVERALQELGAMGGFMEGHDSSHSTLTRVDVRPSVRLAESLTWICHRLPPGSEAEDGGGHEAEDENEQGQESGEAARRVEGSRIVDGGYAEEALRQQEPSPNVPNKPDAAEWKKGKRDKDAGNAVKAGADGSEDVPAVELSAGQEI